MEEAILGVLGERETTQQTSKERDLAGERFSGERVMDSSVGC
jgi:hypothetical protein